MACRMIVGLEMVLTATTLTRSGQAAQNSFNEDNSSGGNCRLPKKTTNKERELCVEAIACAESCDKTWEAGHSMPILRSPAQIAEEIDGSLQATNVSIQLAPL